MDEVKEESSSVIEETVTVKEATMSAEYPSACFLLDSCFQDYQRLLGNYNRIYDKINVALAFAGVVLTIMLGSLDFSPASFCVKDMSVFKLIMTIVELVCLTLGILITLSATLYLLILMRGRKVAVFKSEDIRNYEIYREKEENAALWMIDKYTKIVNEIRPIVQKKQASFDRALIAIIVGIIMYVVAVILQKGGFNVR